MPRPIRTSWGLVAAVLLAAGGCARTVPPDRPSAALYRDVQRLVTLSAAAGWEIDRVEVTKLLPAVLMSVCRAQPAKRVAVLGWLDARIRTLGGPVEVAYRKRGRRLSRVKALLELTRIRTTLARAISVAERDCPFWLEPDPDFRGRQIADDRWQLSFGGGGKVIGIRQGGQFDLQFGGSSRLVVGRAIGSRISLLFGGEVGGSASFPRDADGQRGELVVAVDVVAPLVFRYRLVNTYLELDAGPLGHFTESDKEFIPGLHVGVAFGGRASRKRWFFPGAVFGVSYERTFPDGEHGPPLHMIKLGFRVAVDMDF